MCIRDSERRDDLLCNPETFEGAMSHHMSRFEYDSLYVAMNELSNHDHSRFLTRTNGPVSYTHLDVYKRQKETGDESGQTGQKCI